MRIATQSVMAPVPHPNAIPQPPESEGQLVTLLELVQAVGEVTSNEAEVVATVVHMLLSGHVRLCGNFRDAPVDLFDS
jgi:hypothetical protein